MKTMKKIVAMLAVVAAISCSFVMPAGAANVQLANPQTMLDAASAKTGIPANVDDMLKNHVITTSEKKLIEKDKCITRAVAYRVLLPVYGIYPYPAEFYPEIALAAQCINDYANARCAAITLGLTTPEQNPIQVMSASELKVLIAALDKGLTLPEIKTDIPYLQNIVWDRTSYEGRNSMMSAYSKLPAGWIADFDAQGWSIKYELPTSENASQNVVLGLTTAGSTSYTEKVIRIGRSDPQVTVHEFVHYVVKRAGVSKEQMEVVFKAEAAAMKDTLGIYSQTKASEYVPEFTAYWLLHADQQDSLRAIAPLTAQLAETLIAWH